MMMLMLALHMNNEVVTMYENNTATLRRYIPGCALSSHRRIKPKALLPSFSRRSNYRHCTAFMNDMYPYAVYAMLLCQVLGMYVFGSWLFVRGAIRVLAERHRTSYNPAAKI